MEGRQESQVPQREVSRKQRLNLGSHSRPGSAEVVSCGFVNTYGFLEEGICGVREQGSISWKGPFLGCWNVLCLIGSGADTVHDGNSAD